MRNRPNLGIGTLPALLALVGTLGCAASSNPREDTTPGDVPADAQQDGDGTVVDAQPDLGEDAATLEISSEGGPWCRPCTSDADCEPGDACHRLSFGNYCFSDCETTADCGTGWMCYKLGNKGKQCIPMSFSCKLACLRSGCPAGSTCDQQTGTCEESIGVCGTCDQDWDCAEGLRCYQAGQYCTLACTDTCPTNGVCEQVNEIPVTACVSQGQVCCIGEGCGPVCPEEVPHRTPSGGCVECVEDANCASGVCIADFCTSLDCPNPSVPFEIDGKCVECLISAHCDFDEDCSLYHSCVSYKPPCWYCQDPYPACTQLNGVWSCVQCTDDSYCTGEQTCDTSIFACTGGGIVDPFPPCAGCVSDDDCVSLSGVFDLACDVPSGCCYDLAGACDGVEANCLSGECESILALFGGDEPYIPLPEGLLFAHCTCEQPIDTMTLANCLQVESCPSGDCPPEAVCLDVDDLITWVAQPQGWPPDFPGLCIGVDVLLQSFLPGG